MKPISVAQGLGWERFAACLLLLTSAFSFVGQAQTGCESTAESMQQIRTQLAQSPKTEDLEDALQQLKYITNTGCPNDGDAWYLRAKVEERLKRPTNERDYSLNKARQYRSAALSSGLDPFGGSASTAVSGQPASVPNNTTPPTIRIISPPLTRGVGFRITDKITIVGEASAATGIREVRVQNQPARLSGNGRFEIELALKPEENQITVQATDNAGLQASQSFTLRRETGTNPTPPPAPLNPGGTYYALLLAVQDYADPSVQKLENPIADAKRLQAVLTSAYSFEAKNVWLLENPRRQTIIEKLDELARNLRPEDHLLIFYAGHGHWDEKLKQGFWLPSDAQSPNRSRANWIPNGTLRDYLRGIPTRHTLLISDACFSGGIFVSRDAFGPTPAATEALLELPSRTALTSGAMTTVPDQSVFIKYLLQRLSENKAPALSATALFNQIREPVINNSPNRQTPRYGVVQEANDEGGDFFFIRIKP
jgi:hypothetical protein